MTPHEPVIFGEILMDLFPGGSRILGGSALNVAWHLKGLGWSPILFSRVGSDSFGKEALSLIENWGLSTNQIQIDKEHATGTVQVSIDDTGTITYQTGFPTAFDFIAPANLNSNLSLLYYGTYSLRFPTSLATLKEMKKSAECLFVDLNLRPPHYTRETIDEALRGADWVKINEAEFFECFQKAATTENALEVIHERKIPRFLITRGSEGASYLDLDEKVIEANFNPSRTKIFDTVGAGDGFSAAMIASILEGRDLQTSIDFACKFAGMLCEIRGATTTDRKFYSGI